MLRWNGLIVRCFDVRMGVIFSPLTETFSGRKVPVCQGFAISKLYLPVYGTQVITNQHTKHLKPEIDNGMRLEHLEQMLLFSDC